MASPLHRPGFSLIEALVVLAISGMALAIIFSIGVKAGDSGFALGRRAMAAADMDVSIGDVRSLFRSVSVRPAAMFRRSQDHPLIGSRLRFEGEIVAERATLCSPAGWSGQLVLTVERKDSDATLMCRAGGQSVELLRTPGASAGLSYSRDGRTWTTMFDSTPPDRSELEAPRSEALFIRFQDGARLDIIDRAGSGKPLTWIDPSNGL